MKMTKKFLLTVTHSDVGGCSLCCARKSVGGGYWPKDNIGFRASQGKTCDLDLSIERQLK